MKKYPRSLTLLRLCCAALVLTAGSACSEAPRNGAPAAPVPAPASAAVPARTLAQQIDAEIGDAACDSAQQCSTLAVGHKACGGPDGYRAWSSKRSDGAKLSKLAERQAQEIKEADARSGRMSTCSVVTDPGATCSAGKCVLKSATNAAM